MILWQPSASRIERAQSSLFIREKVIHHDRRVQDFHSLYAWSLRENLTFWRELVKFLELRCAGECEPVVIDAERMPGAQWFPNARVNFAEHLLRYADEQDAIVFWGEGSCRRSYTYRELRAATAACAAWLRDQGIKSGDRVAALTPNIPEAIIAMLAATSLGAIWSSCSPDFGVSGIVDRFGQIGPRVLITADGYLHKGKWIPIADKVDAVRSAVPEIQQVLTASYRGEEGEWSKMLSSYDGVSLPFERLPWSHPLFIMYSSGTTGKPKCIVHSHGGTLLEHLKELVLHMDLTRADRYFYQTSCGWMMWNLLASGLGTGATILLYDGAPLHEDGRILWRMADEERCTLFGTNAKYLAELERIGCTPAKEFRLSHLHSVLSTGSVLAPESFDYVYSEISSDVLLSSISGGTDIIGCFALGSPTLPVYRGELQTRSLGLAVEVFSDEGRPVVEEKGELVCTRSFPSMPVGFWNDSDGSRYRAAYFERFPGVWHHGDFVELNRHGGMRFFGRSDTTLKPGGIRIGTAEIYRQVEKIPSIADSLVIGQEWKSDTRIVLFVKLAPHTTLNDELLSKLRSTIREGASPFHVPRKIIAVPDIPRTRSGKLVEIAVRDIVHGRPVKNEEALLNPESLEYFRDLDELQRE